MTHYVDPEKAQFEAFRNKPASTTIQMLNLIRLRAAAAYEDDKGGTGLEAYRRYGREAEPIFRRVGGRQVWLGHFDLTLIGPADERWDLAFIAEYPNTDAFIEMVRDPAYQLAVKHRQAAVEDSRLIRLRPASPGSGFGEG